MQRKPQLFLYLFVILFVSGCAYQTMQPEEAADANQGLTDANQELTTEAPEATPPEQPLPPPSAQQPEEPPLIQLPRGEALCGNGVVDENENCGNCIQDAACGADANCVEGACVETERAQPESVQPPEPNVPQVNLMVSLTEWFLSEGEGFYVYGQGKYLGKLFRVEVQRIGQSGLTYIATFDLLDENGMLVDRQTAGSEEEITFYDGEWDRVQLSANLYVKGIQIPAGD